jgi:hypothetical protein
MTPLVFSESQIQALADRAKAALPAQVNGRIEKAVRLVRSASVELHPDGSATVLSETDGLTGYLVQHGRCTCPDFQFGLPGSCPSSLRLILTVCKPGTMPSFLHLYEGVVPWSLLSFFTSWC